MNYCPLKNCLLASALALASLNVIGQNQSDAVAYQSFDKTVQVKNAAYNNGKIHFNPYRSIDKTFRYYNTTAYLKGNISFDGQWYNDLSIKYDLLKDNLVIKCDGEGNQIGFNPVRQRIDAFTIGGLTFRNLDLVTHPAFVTGFYEESDYGNVKLYTKYIKDQFQSLNGEIVMYTYVERIEFVIWHRGNFYRIDNQRDVTKAFPQIETQIVEFFNTNAPLEKADRKQFMKKLANRLAELLNTTAK